MGLGVLLTVWVWDTAAEASEWGSLYFEALLHPDDGGCRLPAPQKREKHTKI